MDLTTGLYLTHANLSKLRLMAWVLCDQYLNPKVSQPLSVTKFRNQLLRAPKKTTTIAGKNGVDGAMEKIWTLAGYL